MTRPALLLALTGLSLGGCSVVVTEIDVSCSKQADCDALNAKAGLGADTCEYYQCRDSSRGCEKLPRDDDGDGHLDQATCALERPKHELDCDDRDDGGETRHPGAMEMCDGIDNDCDGLIDEEVWGLAPAPDVPLSQVHWLSTAAPSAGHLPVVATTHKVSSAVSDLYLVSTDAPPASLSLQKDSASCTKSAGLIEGCTLPQIAVALASNAWLAMGVDIAGCEAGAVRFASSALDDHRPALWDGDRTSKSNLRTGAPGVPSCAAPGARAPTLVAGTDGLDALALWRASAANAGAREPGLLLGLGLGVRPNPGASPSVYAFSGGPPAPLREHAPGLDPARALSWHQGFLVAHDVPEGLELAYVTQLERGVGRAFAAASRFSFAQVGARHVALAIAEDGAADERELIAAAWRVHGPRGWTLYFAAVSPASPERLTPRDALSPVTIASEAAISAGPALAHVSRGFAIDAEGKEVGGWFVLWIEEEATHQTLKAARVRSEGDELLDDALTLHEADHMDHVFAHALNDRLKYGVVSGTGGTQQLNIGSLLCTK